MPETTRGVKSEGPPRFEGIHIELEYETKISTAFLLRSYLVTRPEIPGETYLPPLLTRMPSTVRDVLIDYLTSAFDVHIEPMRLSSHFLENVLERLLETAGTHERHIFEPQVKGIQLVVGFKALIAPNMGNLSVDIKREDVPAFLNRGKAMTRKQEHDKYRSRSGSFMCSMRDYIKEQTVLDTKHSLVKILRLTCRGCVLVADGKLKVVL